MRDNAVVILFLDFDGVLRRLQAPEAELETCCLEAFEDALRSLPDAEIVITSNWRECNPVDELRRLFPESIRARIVGATPLDDSREDWARHREVLAYLRSRGLEDRPWIAIDDNPLHYPSRCPVLLIDPEVGFNRDAGRQLVERVRRLEAHVSRRVRTEEQDRNTPVDIDQ